MLGDAVQIEVAPDVDPALAKEVASVCDAAMGPDRCWLADGEVSASSEWVAVVSQDEHGNLKIELRRASEAGVVARRTLVFEPEDTPERRWESAGVVVAALVAAQVVPAPADEDKPAKPQAERPPTNPPPQPVRPAPSRRRLRGAAGSGRKTRPNRPRQDRERERPTPRAFGLDTGALLGPGLDAGAYRVGVFGRGWVTLLGPVTAQIGGQYATRGPDPAVHWTAADLGLGVQVRPGAFVVEGRAFVAGGWESVKPYDPNGGPRESGGVVRYGGGTGVLAAWRASRFVQPFVAAELAWLQPPLGIKVGGVRTDSEGSFRWVGAAGIRWDFSGVISAGKVP